MPPRVMGAQEAGNGFQNFIESMPPITRAFAGTVFCGAAATYVGILNPFVVALVWPAVLQKYQVRGATSCQSARGPCKNASHPPSLAAASRRQGDSAARRGAALQAATPKSFAVTVATHAAACSVPPPLPAVTLCEPNTSAPPPPQVWRLVTCHTYMPFGMSFVFMMLFLIKYGGNLESEVYRFNPAGGAAGPGSAMRLRQHPSPGQRAATLSPRPRRGPGTAWACAAAGAMRGGAALVLRQPPTLRQTLHPQPHPAHPHPRPPDYLFMLLFGAAFLSVVPPLVGFPMFFTTVPLIMMIVYVWSRNFPETQVGVQGWVTGASRGWREG